MTDLKNYQVPPMFRYCNFGNTTMMDGTVLKTDGEPIALNGGNVIFPTGWSEQQILNWRDANGLAYPDK